MTHIVDFSLIFSGQSCNNIIREFNTFCFFQKFRCEFLCLQSLFHLNKDCDLVDEPFVDLCDRMDLVIRDSFAECFCDHPDSAVIYDFQFFQNFFFGKCWEIIRKQAVYMLLQRTDCFHKSSFKVIANTHNFSGSFHLCRQRSLCTDKFIERKSRHLNNTVVKHWLEACISFLCNCILDLVQCISKGNLCSNFCDRVSCRFGSQCRRTAYTRVYLNYTIFKRVWM